MEVGTRYSGPSRGSRFGPPLVNSPSMIYASEQLVVPKSIAAILVGSCRHLASLRGTRLATSQPLECLQIPPILGFPLAIVCFIFAPLLSILQLDYYW